MTSWYFHTHTHTLLMTIDRTAILQKSGHPNHRELVELLELKIVSFSLFPSKSLEADLD